TSPSPMSIARVARESKPALNKPCGSARDAPLKKFTFRWSRKAAMATTLPLYDQTGVFHFHSSTKSVAASRISFLRRGRVRPSQSPTLLMYLVMVSDVFIGLTHAHES